MCPNTEMQKSAERSKNADKTQTGQTEYHRELEHRFQRQSGQEQGAGPGLNTQVNRWTWLHQAITGVGKSQGTNQNMTRQNTDFTGEMWRNTYPDILHLICYVFCRLYHVIPLAEISLSIKEFRGCSADLKASMFDFKGAEIFEIT